MKPINKIVSLLIIFFVMSQNAMSSISGGGGYMSKQTLILKASINKVASLGYELSFRLENNSKKTIRIEKTNFHRSNVVLFLAEDKAHGDIFREDRFPDGLTAGVWEISPGDVVETSLNLSSRFPALNNKSEGHTVAFWKVTIRLIDETEKQTFGGYLIINNEDNKHYSEK